jgi:iron(III) transport system ATP-binding protein
MDYFKVSNLSFSYTKHYKLINNFSLSLAQSEIVAIIGDSGSGKSTILRLIAGLCDPSSGQISLNDNLLYDKDKNINIDSEKRSIGMIFQDYALFPHLTVLKNVMFAIKGSRETREYEAHQLLTKLNISEQAYKYPHQTSGGQQQRIAIARALATKPQFLLLDEPFSNLDSRLKSSVRAEIKAIIKARGIGALLVTHDLDDVTLCADRAVNLSAT